MIKYSEPKQDYKGMWYTKITDENGKLIQTTFKTTKKSLLDFIKKSKEVLR
jgi:hypothetical protein